MALEILCREFKANCDYFNEVDSLYRLSFPTDSNEFVDYFLHVRLNESQAYLLYNDKNLVSMLFCIKKSIRIYGKDCVIPFIVACATHPNWRGRGYIGRLFDSFFANEFKKKTAFVFLNPFDHNYYRRFGFATVDFVSNSLDKSISLAEKCTDSAILGEIYEKFCTNFDIHQVRCESEWKQKIFEVGIDGGEFRLLRDRSRNCVGFALVFEGRIIESALLGGSSVRCLKQNTQARIISAESAISQLNRGEKSFEFALFDDRLNNSGIYHIEKGKLFDFTRQDSEALSDLLIAKSAGAASNDSIFSGFVNLLDNEREKGIGEKPLTLGIGELAAALFGTHKSIYKTSSIAQVFSSPKTIFIDKF